MKLVALTACVATVGLIGCKKEVPPPQKAAGAVATTNQGTTISDGRFTWHLGPGFMKDGTNVTRDGTNWPAGEFKVVLRTTGVSN